MANKNNDEIVNDISSSIILGILSFVLSLIIGNPKQGRKKW